MFLLYAGTQGLKQEVEPTPTGSTEAQTLVTTRPRSPAVDVIDCIADAIAVDIVKGGKAVGIQVTQCMRVHKMFQSLFM